VAWSFTLSGAPVDFAYPINELGDIGALTAWVLFLHEQTGGPGWAPFSWPQDSPGRDNGPAHPDLFLGFAIRADQRLRVAHTTTPVPRVGRRRCKAMNGLVASWTATPATVLGCSTRPLLAVRSCIDAAPPPS
jgi:hypothetical protein